MPWQETCVMTERMHFVMAATRGEVTMAAACRAAGMSRTQGDTWVERFRTEGVAGLTDRSRAPHRRPQATEPAVREAVLALRARHPRWGPKKLVASLRTTNPAVPWPAPSTVGDLLKAAGLVTARRPRRHAPPRTQPLAHATAPNVVWCADFNGDVRLGDGTRCYPLTISDAHSRVLLRCQALPLTGTARVQPLFEATFREYGVPLVLRTDNGPPFASVGAGGLTPLSVWWVRLGITPERIDPGQPQQNGRHERMHRTLKAETGRTPAVSLRAQQHAFDRFRTEYNDERPHEALGQVPPATVYTPSVRPFPERLPDLVYPAADAVRWVRPNGALRWHGQEVYVSASLAGQPVAVAQVGDGDWRLMFGPIHLGILDERTGRLTPARATKRPDLSPMSAV